jgi:outer membrane autotransporter protein
VWIYNSVGAHDAVTNSNSGTITATATSVTDDATAYGIGISGSLGNGAVVSNAGTITVKANSSQYNAYGYGIYVDGVLADGDLADANNPARPTSIINTGTITATADGFEYASAYGVEVYGAVGAHNAITNSNSGTITATATAVTDTASAYGIYVYGSVGDGTVISNSGNITAKATSSHYDATAYGIYVDGSLVSATDSSKPTSIVNSGHITAVANGFDSASAYGIYVGGSLGSDAAVTNNGSIVAQATQSHNYDDATAYGIYTGSLTGTGAKVTNNGQITVTATAETAGYGSAYGIRTGSMGSDTAVTNSSTGTISVSVLAGANANYAYGTAYGIYVGGGMGTNATIENDGTISVSAQAVGTSYPYAYGIYLNGGGMDTGASLTNSGHITADALGETSAYAYGVIIGGAVSSGATVTNGGSISVSAEATKYGLVSAEGIDVSSGGVAGSISNSNTGTITVTAVNADSRSSATAYGVRVSGNISGSLTNSGKISATASAANPSAAYAYGVRADALDGVLTNTSTGAITGTASQANQGYSIWAGSGAGNVVNSGALIGNLNLRGSISLSNSGLVALPTGSNAIVGGSYEQTDTGTLAVGVKGSSSGEYASLNVMGNVTLPTVTKLAVKVDTSNTLANNDAILGVLAAGGTMTPGSTFTVTDNSPEFNFTAAYNGTLNGVDLTAVSSGFSSLAGAVGGTPMTGTAAALENMLNNNSSDPALQGFFNMTTVGDAVSAVKQASPMTGNGRASLNAMRGGQLIIGARQAALRGQSSGDSFVTDRQWWFKPFGSKADQNSSDGVPGYTADTYGLAIGADGELSSANRIGAAFTYAHTKVDSNDSVDQTNTVNSYQATIYGTHDLDASTFLDYQGDVGMNSNDSKRTFTLASAVASASYNSLTAHAGAGLGRLYSVNPKTVFTPSVHLDYAMVSDDSYTESGAGVLDLKVNSHTTDELVLAADGKVDFSVSDTAKLTANLGVGYDALADRDAVTAAFAGTPGASFSARGVNPSSWLVRGGLGYVMSSSSAMQVTARYDIDARDGFTNQTVSLKVMKPF